MTGVQSAAEVRDVPESCLCSWMWRPETWTWVRVTENPNCIWHKQGDTP